MSGPYVVIEDLSFEYQPGTPRILSGLQLEMGEQEFFVLLGPSGCGKTTVLNLLAGFELPSSGRITVDGRYVSGPGPDRVVIFQGDDSLLGWLSTIENVEFGLKMARVVRESRRTLARKALEMVGLAGQDDKYPHQLSGGMKQRVQIARALVHDASMLLMDEPFAALDAQTRANLQDELSRIWSTTKRTVLFITHDISEAIILGDRIGVMTAGPGSRMKQLFQNELPRPRRRGDAAFGAMYAQIERAVAEEARRASVGTS